MNSVITTSAEETQKIAQELASTLKGGDVLLLYGNLGHGKTTFIQGLARGLGIERRLISPTFVIVRKYELNNKKAKFFYHIDLYRTQTVKDIEGIGLKEILLEKDSIVAIEWPEKLGDLMPHNRKDIYFELVDENKRKITIKDE